MKAKGVRLHGANDLRLEEFELPEITDDEILVKVISDSICMSTYKCAILGTEHKRVHEDVAEHPVVLRMKKYPHHGDTSCYKHCMRVAYFNYIICKKLHLDAKSAARAGMMHDLFLYDWHTHARETGERLHGFTHAEKAYKNAGKIFRLNRVERDVIRNHMWPVTLRSVPRTREGWMIVLTDKYSGFLETLDRRKKNKKNCI